MRSSPCSLFLTSTRRLIIGLYRLQINNLGQELLTFLLLPTILKTEKENPGIPKPRIVVVSSGVAHQTSLDEDLINHPHILKRMSEADYCTSESVFSYTVTH